MSSIFLLMVIRFQRGQPVSQLSHGIFCKDKVMDLAIENNYEFCDYGSHGLC